jgi:hypothetical protein
VPLICVSPQPVDEALVAVDRTFHARAVEPQVAQNDRVFETEIALDAQVARIEEAVDHRAVDHQRIGEVEAGEIETGGVRIAAEHRPDDPDAGRRDRYLLLGGDPLDDVGGKPPRVAFVAANLVPISVPAGRAERHLRLLRESVAP